jgi:hypothetical protein
MANTPEQDQYDKDLAALKKLTGAERVKRKEAFDLKYPKGRPTGTAASTSPDMSGLTTSLGFVLSRALLDDPIYGQGPRGLQAVYDLWAAGDQTAALNAYFQSD